MIIDFGVAMNITFDEIAERDIDLLVMDLFSKSASILSAFCKEASITLSNAIDIISIEHSYMDITGESDITLIVKDEDKKVGILIENKIAAEPQPDQKRRYYLRGDNGVNEGKYDSFFVVLIAPEEYCKSDAQNYERKVSYEKLIDIVKESNISDKTFCVAMFERAIYKKEREHGYTMVPDDEATDFINGYIRCWKENGFDVRATMSSKEGKKHPTSGGWIEYSIPGLKGLSITHKTDRGCVDLTFNKCKGMTVEIHELLKETIEDIEKYEVEDLTGASAAIRRRCKEMNPKKCFDGQEKEALEGMRLVIELSDLAKKLDWKKVSELLEKGVKVNSK